MKKERVVLGMSVKALVFMLILFGISAASLFAQSELEGMWTHYMHQDSKGATFIFSGDNFIYKQADEVVFEGTFTITTSGNTNTMNLTGTNGTTFSVAYTLNDDMSDAFFRIRTRPRVTNWPRGVSSFMQGDYAKSIPHTDIDGTWKHPNPQAQDATFTFSGDEFTYTKRGTNRSGTIERVGNVITLKVSGREVRRYVFVFYEAVGDSMIALYGLSGDGNTYFWGPFERQ